LTHIVASLERAKPGIGAEASAILSAFPPPPPQSILAILVNDLLVFALPINLVLDDYQFISTPAIHEGITFLLNHQPSNLHLVIATRSDPPIPLARLRARNQLLELRADDLRFSPQEAAAFLNQVMNLSLSAEEIATLENRTEGWIAGLQMAAVSMQGHSDISRFIQAFSGSHRYILDYLTGEALNGQPQDVQQFLLWTSILDRLCAPLCSELIGNTETLSQEILEYLDRTNLFLIALDEERCWFRYHHLFADLLRARLQQSQPDLLPELHIRATIWLEKNGFIPEAIQHAFSAHDNERAGELIERHGPTRWSYSDPSILTLAGNLPSEMLRNRPRLGLYQAWFLIAQGKAQAALQLLYDLVKLLPAESSNPEGRWMRSVAELLLAYTKQTGEDSQIQLPDYQALELISEQDLGLHNTADVLYAMLLCRREELELAAEILFNCVRRDMAANGTTAIPMAIPFLARLRLMQGRLRDSATLCREYLKPVTQRGKNYFYASGSLNIVLGEVLREWNNLEEAEEQIREGLRANEPWNNILSDVIGFSALARVQQAKGNLEGAFETLDKLERMLQGHTKPPDQEDELRALWVRLWLAKGDLVSAGEWADQFHWTEPLDFSHELDYLSRARIWIAQGKYPEAQHILEALTRQPGMAKRNNRQIKIDLLLAIALSGQNLTSQALQVLESCLSLAEPDGHVRVFLDNGEPLRELLAAYLRRPNPLYKAYAQKLLAGFARPTQGSLPGAFRAELVEPLTPREIEVLRLLTEGFSNRQIAEKLILSEGTVKFHVHSILEKIQVHSRTQAIAKAKGLNLI
jgi:LuxR family maltose regulon positive regulatory protein